MQLPLRGWAPPCCRPAAQIARSVTTSSISLFGLLLGLLLLLVGKRRHGETKICHGGVDLPLIWLALNLEETFLRVVLQCQRVLGRLLSPALHLTVGVPLHFSLPVLLGNLKYERLHVRIARPRQLLVPSALKLAPCVVLHLHVGVHIIAALQLQRRKLFHTFLCNLVLVQDGLVGFMHPLHLLVVVAPPFVVGLPRDVATGL
mmetsp:Transcript_69460/g.224677  ORF Transcript_69460/g.224677 Transcript_69460/m.224677 type:complete len:203 (+) Transcript_69460:37-645(+)